MLAHCPCSMLVSLATRHGGSWGAALQNPTLPPTLQSIQRTGPDLLTDAAVHEGLTREEGVFKQDVYHVNGLGMCLHAGWMLCVVS